MKRIFKYVKGITNFGLWYTKGHELSMVAYMDADWEGNIDDRRRTS
jgi:hypothetical protein